MKIIIKVSFRCARSETVAQRSPGTYADGRTRERAAEKWDASRVEIGSAKAVSLARQVRQVRQVVLVRVGTGRAGDRGRERERGRAGIESQVAEPHDEHNGHDDGGDEDGDEQEDRADERGQSAREETVARQKYMRDHVHSQAGRTVGHPAAKSGWA